MSNQNPPQDGSAQPETPPVSQARWGFVYDTDETWVTGEFLLAADGRLLCRMGGSRTSGEGTSYSFGQWEPVDWWDGTSDPDAAIIALKSSGYSLTLPGPTAVDESTAGPFRGIPALATYL